MVNGALGESSTTSGSCLQTSYFPHDHTGELIAQGFREALQSWGLKEELQVCITTDNGANVVKAEDDYSHRYKPLDATC